VYLMGSLSGTLYIGVTGNLHKRIFQHKFHRTEGFTDKYRVERLLYRESFDDVHKAIAREKQLKGWRRSKKIALIESVNPHWLDLAREWYPSMTSSGELNLHKMSSCAQQFRSRSERSCEVEGPLR
jgi:putative endonuclease